MPRRQHEEMLITSVQACDCVPPMTRFTRARKNAGILRVFLHFLGALPAAGGNELVSRFLELAAEPAEVVEPELEDVPLLTSPTATAGGLEELVLPEAALAALVELAREVLLLDKYVSCMKWRVL
jgi:hypothetical protein